MRKNRGYFAPLVTLVTVIDAPGLYVTRAGVTVSLSSVSSRHDFGNLGSYPNGTAEGWHRSGRLYAGTQCQNDIVRKAP